MDKSKRRLCDEGMKNLMVGIVKQAAEDYRLALYQYKIGERPLSYAEGLEAWFTSPDGDRLCAGQGDYIVKRIKEEVLYGKY